MGSLLMFHTGLSSMETPPPSQYWWDLLNEKTLSVFLHCHDIHVIIKNERDSLVHNFTVLVLPELEVLLNDPAWEKS